MSKYLKAYICSYENARPNLGTRFYVQFNPAELSIEEAIGMTEEDAGAGLPQYFLQNGGIGWQRPADSAAARKRKNCLTLSVTLFFNTLNDLYQESYEDVRKYIRKLYPYTNKNTENKTTMKQIYFFWGSVAVAGVLTRLHVQYTMFAPDGTPVRAQAELSIEGDYVGEEGASSGETQASEEIGGLAADRAAGAAVSSAGWRAQAVKTANPRL